ncbi:aldose epimerase family protein [Echinimonas agarilytica]|uniref:Aldose 1-epimerase n=1 Tax=Echinimonas agarilytica TaxID=1215918 RepID=A0AA41W459_9GAMM|nr:aldose epimerase family protein [Echinimonas agarilytica]MCM2678223.1 galactose mutarotase [Echinimonas agarilytica]
MDTATLPKIDNAQWAESGYSIYELTNTQGTCVLVSDLGATIVSLYTRNRHQRLSNIVLGYDTPQEYLESQQYLGASIGRVANRIDNGEFEVDGVRYQITRNDGEHCLHGGLPGLHCKQWDLVSQSSSTVSFEIVSPDGECGFPGDLKVRANFELTDDDQLQIVYEATTNKATPVCLTNHSYFNLADEQASILDHEVSIAADHYLSVNDKFIPRLMVPVADTAFDFTSQKSVRSQIMCYEPQLFLCGGFDHNFCLVQESKEKPSATIYSPESGRKVEMFTSTPGLQFYTGNQLYGETGQKGQSLRKYAGLCLEPQFFPNQINTDSAEECILRPGTLYTTSITLKFSND